MQVYKPPKKQDKLQEPQPPKKRRKPNKKPPFPVVKKPPFPVVKKPGTASVLPNKKPVVSAQTKKSPKKPSLKLQKYKAPNRDPTSGGSQNEKPGFVRQGENILIKGYQRFKIGPVSIFDIEKHSEKYTLIKSFIESKMGECETISDVGSSNGLVAFIAAFYKYSTIYALDHDAECIELIKNVATELNIPQVIAKRYSFGEPHEPTDIVFALALIHWIFSCTALMGAFEPIIAYFKSITKRYLVIEWIEPTDPCIKALKHIDYNRACIKEPYTKPNFLKALKGHFTRVNKSAVVYSKTRELYLCTV